LHVSDGSGTLNVDLEIIGYQAGGGQVSTTLFSSDVGSTINFSGFDNLEYVEFILLGDYNPVAINDGGYWPVVSIDNVTVAPVPAAVWLLGSALAGLGWMRRRHAV